MKQFVVIGLGNFGFNVAKSLALKGHQILAIDLNPGRVEEIKDIVTNAISADARSRKVISEFVPVSADAVIVSMGRDLEASIILTHYLKIMKIKHIVVKAVNEEHVKILEIVGADEIIFPERDMATRLADKLSEPNLLERIPFASDFGIIEVAVPDSYYGKTIRQIGIREKYNILVIAVKDILKDKFYLMPDPDYKLLPDSLLIIMGKHEDIAKWKFK